MASAKTSAMETPPDCRRDWPESGADVISSGYDYANQFEVGFSRDEVLLRMAQAYEGDVLHARPRRVVMTPAYAKALLQLLSETITRYEAEYGTVRAAGAGVTAQEDGR